MIKTYGHQSKGDQAKEGVAYGWEAAMQAVEDWLAEQSKALL